MLFKKERDKFMEVASDVKEATTNFKVVPLVIIVSASTLLGFVIGSTATTVAFKTVMETNR